MAEKLMLCEIVAHSVSWDVVVRLPTTTHFRSGVRLSGVLRSQDQGRDES